MTSPYALGYKASAHINRRQKRGRTIRDAITFLAAASIFTALILFSALQPTL